mmetsp:Transcript_6877/g.12148  ORF Transcript_6877/g.12148 Transcript_6877/m.12148 type:complete len:471 (+) Transcript_6877:61-1473(+)
MDQLGASDDESDHEVEKAVESLQQQSSEAADGGGLGDSGGSPSVSNAEDAPKETSRGAESDEGDDKDGDESDASDDSDDQPKKKKIIKKKKKKLVKKASKDRDSSDDSDDSDGRGKPKAKKIIRKKKKAKAADASSEHIVVNDDTFIASDDDNEELAAEYQHQKEYESEEDPYADEDKLDPEQDGGPIGTTIRAGGDGEAVPDADSFGAVLHKMKQQRSAARYKEATDEEMMAQGEAIITRMRAAALRDNRDRSKKKPAVHKLKMLEEVVAALLHKDLGPHLLEYGVLKYLGDWLKPSPVDNTLPAQSLRTRIIDLIPQLQITLDHLESSKFGRILAFLQSHEKELPGNKKKINQMIANWSQMIFRKKSQASSMNSDMTPSENQVHKKRKVQSESGSSHRRGLDALTEAPTQNSTTKTSARAMIPQQMNFEFSRQPKDNAAKQDSTLRPSAKRLDLEKKLVAGRKKRKGL